MSESSNPDTQSEDFDTEVLPKDSSGTEPTSSCPFCGVGVDPDLLVFGGNCPQCLIEILGEEAPTEPGEGAPSTEEVARVELGKAPSRAPLVVGALVLLAVGAGAWWKMQAVPDPGVVEEEEATVFQAPDDHQDQFYGEKPEPEPEEEVVVAPVRRVEKPKTEVPSLFSKNPLGLAGPAPTVKMPERVKIETQDDGDASVANAIAGYSGQLQYCYEQRLKDNPRLSGTWVVGFAIERGGFTSSVRIRPRGASDSTLEACMKRKVESWKFDPMSERLQIDKPYTFGS
ncbi:MAG: AgmX/PglI C-terminal domain-containing protein [Myxococcota bacterium]|jgi:hypothetical protein|nr:AgmX/PglI C-terminal domain-containing protein [Myxococcota bacterium]